MLQEETTQTAKDILDFSELLENVPLDPKTGREITGERQWDQITEALAGLSSAFDMREKVYAEWVEKAEDAAEIHDEKVGDYTIEYLKTDEHEGREYDWAVSGSAIKGGIIEQVRHQYCGPNTKGRDVMDIWLKDRSTGKDIAYVVLAKPSAPFRYTFGQEGLYNWPMWNITIHKYGGTGEDKIDMSVFTNRQVAMFSKRQRGQDGEYRNQGFVLTPNKSDGAPTYNLARVVGETAKFVNSLTPVPHASK